MPDGGDITALVVEGLVSLAMMAGAICLLVWVYRDASRRGMSGTRWVFVLLISGWVAGFIVYLLVRRPRLVCPHGHPREAEWQFCPYCESGDPPLATSVLQEAALSLCTQPTEDLLPDQVLGLTLPPPPADTLPLRCSRCGRESPAGSRYCVFDGLPLDVALSECPHPGCHYRPGPGDRHCVLCGTPLRAGVLPATGPRRKRK